MNSPLEPSTNSQIQIQLRNMQPKKKLTAKYAELSTAAALHTKQTNKKHQRFVQLSKIIFTFTQPVNRSAKLHTKLFSFLPRFPIFASFRLLLLMAGKKVLSSTVHHRRRSLPRLWWWYGGGLWVRSALGQKSTEKIMGLELKYPRAAS